MAELMAQADIAIMSAGGTTWERMCVGLPGIVIVIAEHQREIANSLADNGLQYVADLSNGNLSEIQALLGKLQNKSEFLKMSQLCSNLIDGLGVKKVVEEMLA